MKKPKPPKTIQEVEAYIQQRGLWICPEEFWNWGEAEDWYRGDGKPVRSWKRTLLTWHSFEIKRRGKPNRCSVSLCKNPGVYTSGQDDTGQIRFRCIQHKPDHVPSLPRGIIDVFHSVPSVAVNVSNRRNKQAAALSRKGERSG